MDKIIKIYDLPGLENHSFFYYLLSVEWQDQLTMHQHDAWELMCILSGRGIRIIGDTIEPFKSGEVILIPPSIPHNWNFDSTNNTSIKHVLVSFTQDFLLKCIGLFPELRNRMNEIEFPTSALSLYSADNIRKALIDMNDKTDLERLSMLLCLIPDIFTHASSVCVGNPFRQDKDSKRMQQVYAYVMRNFQREISLDDIVAEINMGRSSFCTYFKKHNGEPFFRFLAKYRIDMACNMLKNSELGISEICLSVGFNDIPHFNRVFKQLKSASPREYRKNNTT